MDDAALARPCTVCAGSMAHRAWHDGPYACDHRPRLEGAGVACTRTQMHAWSLTAVCTSRVARECYAAAWWSNGAREVTLHACAFLVVGCWTACKAAPHAVKPCPLLAAAQFRFQGLELVFRVAPSGCLTCTRADLSTRRCCSEDVAALLPLPQLPATTAQHHYSLLSYKSAALAACQQKEVHVLPQKKHHLILGCTTVHHHTPLLATRGTKTSPPKSISESHPRLCIRVRLFRQLSAPRS